MGGTANFDVRLLRNEEGAAPFLAGSRVSGTLCVTIGQQAVKGTALTLQFLGQESTRVQYTETRNDIGQNARTTTHYANASRNLIAVNLAVPDIMLQDGGHVAAGTHEIPFALELPQSLPSTMVEERNNSYCMIKYQIKAELQGSGILWNYKCDQEVMVVAKPLDTVAIPYSAHPVTEEVNFCCCFNRGSIVFGAKVNDTRLDRGESTTVSFSCCNNTTVAVERIDARLVQECRWNASGHHEGSTTVLQRINFPNFDSLSAHRLLAPRRRIDRADSARNEREVVFREVESGKRTGRVTMPVTAHNSYAGTLLSVQHCILIEVHTGPCVSNPTIRIPVQSGETRSTTTATPQPTPSAAMANEIVVPNSMGVLGGKPTSWEGEEEPEVVFTTEPDLQQSPSLEWLIEQMEDSILDLDIVQSKVNDPAWSSVFQALTPTEFGALIKAVYSDFAQPSVAVAVAGAVGTQFSCAHVAAALGTTAAWNRSALTEQLLPFCRDLVQHQNVILAELTDWEKLTTERAFADALKKAAAASNR